MTDEKRQVGAQKIAKGKVGRPKGSWGKVNPRDLRVLDALNEGKGHAEAMAAGGFKATNSFEKWANRPEIKALLDWNARMLREKALETGFDTLDYLLKLISVRRRMARYLAIDSEGLPCVKFPANIMESEDQDLPTYISIQHRTVGRGDFAETVREVKINYPDDNTTAMNFAKLNGELVDQTRLEISGAQDSDILAAREYARKRKEVMH